MFRVFSFCFLILIAAPSQAQTYTLQQCIDSALANSIPVKQNELLSQSARVQLAQARYNRLPDLNADIFHGLSQGRSIDPNSNSYVNQSLNYASYGLNTNVTVFSGGVLRNAIRQSETGYEASKLEYQQVKDNLTLNVIIAYLQVLNSEDQLVAAKQQAEVSEKELSRLQILNNQGAIKPSELSDLKGQLMNDQLLINAAQNNLETAKLLLAQLMNQPYRASLAVERINIGELLAPYLSKPGEVYETSLQHFAQVRAAALRKRSFEYGVRTAKSGYYPTVYVGSGLATNYSSTAQNAGGKIPYNGQLKNNIATSLGLGLSIPIFNRLQAKNKVTQAEILFENSRLLEEETKRQLRQQIDQAYLNMTAAYERYKLLIEQVAAYTQSFKAAEVRYGAGVGTSYDYLVAKDRLDRANTNLIGAQYEYIFRKKVLEFYSKSQ